MLLKTPAIKMAGHCMIILTIAAILIACTSMSTLMNSWNGHPIDEVISVWGTPDSKINDAGGGFVYTWVNSFTNKSGDLGECQRTFITDSKGMVVNWTQTGCPYKVRN
jgi:hypothetical protein